MNRYAKDRSTGPRPKPVVPIELDEKRIGPRLLVAALLLAVGIFFIATAITQCNAVSSGWTVVQADKSIDTDNAGEFTLLYELGAAGRDATTENKALTVAYTDALEHAAQLFSSLNSYEGVMNLCYLNAHPNETVLVDATLWNALALLEAQGSRDIFLAPLFDDYQSIFFCTDDFQVGYFDPRTNADVRAFFDELLTFIHDPEALSIELLPENRVIFHVSEDYQACCAKWGVTHLLDLGWMKNAFIVDTVADALEEKGFTHGSLSSYDGFIRNMDSRTDVEYAFTIYDRVGAQIRSAAMMTYPPATRTLLFLHTYGLFSPYDVQRYYETEGGICYHAFLDGADGLCKAAVPNLVCGSGSLGCVEMALLVAPVYIADELDVDALEALLVRGIWHVRCEDGAIITNGGAGFTNLAEGYRVA